MSQCKRSNAERKGAGHVENGRTTVTTRSRIALHVLYFNTMYTL